MSKIKDLKIKSLKKVRVFPHILLLIFLILFFVGIIAVFQFWFVSTRFTDKISSQYISALRLTSYVEENMTSIPQGYQIPATVVNGGEYVILDERNVKIGGNYPGNPDLENYYDFPILTENYFLHLDSNSRTMMLFDDIDSFNVVQLVNYYQVQNGGLHLFEMDETFLRKTACEFPGWIVMRMLGGDYTLFYKVNIILTNRDMNNIVMVALFSGALFVVPMAVYIITMIISIVGQSKARRVFYLDTITGGRNWQFFENHAGRVLKRTHKNPNKKYVLVSLRMDKYQNYCLCYGNKEGTDLVERFANSIKKNRLVRFGELYARYAEAEFGFLLKYNTEYETEIRVQSIKNFLYACAGSRKIDFSTGICEAGEEISAATLYGNARVARSNLKPENTSKIAWYNEELKNAQLWEQYVETHMESALANGEFQMYIQPKYNASTRTLGGGEALIRWISPKEGIISPIRFIPIFEKNGFITKIDDFMIRTLAVHQAKWLAEGRKVVPISVNVSRAHFARPDLAEHICEIVEETGAPKEYIELELTESAFFQDREVLIDTVSKLREYGFKVSMDDFGADYSSLNSLKDMPMDVIKLDAGFFRGREENQERGSVIVAGIIELAKQLQMHIVAEGIEYGEQVEFLSEHGCDLIQGYFFAKPMPVAEYEALAAGEAVNDSTPIIVEEQQEA